MLALYQARRLQMYKLFSNSFTWKLWILNFSLCQKKAEIWIGWHKRKNKRVCSLWIERTYHTNCCSSEIWNDKLKSLHNKAHRVTERTEVKAITRRCRWHIERRRRSVQVPYNFWINCLYIESLIKLANMLRRSMHRRCLRDYHYFVLWSSVLSFSLCDITSKRITPELWILKGRVWNLFTIIPLSRLKSGMKNMNFTAFVSFL